MADTIGEASSIPEGNDASPLPLVVSAAETAGRTLPVDWRRVSAAAASSACRYSRSVITGIDAWVSTTTAGAARMKQCERLTQIVWNGSFRRI